MEWGWGDGSGWLLRPLSALLDFFISSIDFEKKPNGAHS